MPRMKCAAVLAGLALVFAGSAALAQTQALDPGLMAPADAALLQDYELYHSRCRGGSGDETDTWVACGARDYIGYLLNQSGYCFGEVNQPSFEMVWHVCTANSERLEKP